MKEKSDEKRFALRVVSTLRDAGFEALWAGGCVRDQLLGISPKDYDVATNAKPDQVRDLFGRKKTIAIGASFGVITVLGKKSEGNIEIATFRQDADYTDGRHPDSVRFSNAEEDAKRRDFTINGLFFDPLAEQVIDFVGGQQDLRDRVIRAIGNPQDRISEDKLRMLRAVRFAATYAFELEASTMAAVKANADSIHVVSRERVAAELRRMLSHPNRAKAVEYLWKCDLLEPVFGAPDLLRLDRVQQAIELLDQFGPARFETAFAGLVFALLEKGSDSRKQKRALAKLFNRWKLSNLESELVIWLVASVEFVLEASAESWPRVQRLLVNKDVSELVVLAEAISSWKQNQYQRNIEYCQQQLKLPQDKLDPAPLLSGDDLRAAGLEPSPKFKTILEQVRDRQLMGEIATLDEALKYARQLG